MSLLPVVRMELRKQFSRELGVTSEQSKDWKRRKFSGFLMIITTTNFLLWVLTEFTAESKSRVLSQVQAGIPKIQQSRSCLRVRYRAIFHNKIVWVNGPFPAGQNDMKVFRKPDGLMSKIPEGCLAIGDEGYRGEPKKVSTKTSTMRTSSTNSKTECELDMKLQIPG